MKTIVRIEEKSKRHEVEGSAGVAEGHPAMVEYDSRIAMIRALIPLGLEAVKDLLEQEVTRLAGERYERVGGLAGHARWGSQRGSVYLSDQKVAMNVQLTMELAGRIDALPTQPIFKPNLPCGSIPTSFVVEAPVCAQKLIEAMNVTNVRVLSREAAKAEMERQDEVIRNLTGEVWGSGERAQQAESDAVECVAGCGTLAG